MIKKCKSIMSIIVAMIICFTMIAGCGQKENAISKTETKVTTVEKATDQEDLLINGVDTSKEVKLIGYLLGGAPNGMDAVMEEVNKKLKKDINTTVEIRHISWGDFVAKYPLILASGSEVDFIYTANWSFYAQEALKGAFHPITVDEIEKYMPLHFAATDKVAYEQADINGKMYMITTASPDRKVPVAIIRGDLRKKYGVDEINNFSEINNYLAAIKENEKEMIPLKLSSGETATPYFGLIDAVTDGYRSSVPGIFESKEPDNNEIKALYEEGIVDIFKTTAYIMKDWHSKGYINQDVFANKITSKDSFIEGTSAVGFGNTQDFQSVLASAKSKGWEIEIIPLVNQKGHHIADPYINNGVGLASSSENKERTMLALDLLLEDESYNNLVYFGIEGTNYVVKDGKIDLPEGVTAEENTYPPDASGFWFVNKNNHLPLASWDKEYIELREELRGGDTLLDHPLAAFNLKLDDVQTEVANITQVYAQYFHPIQVGMVEDIDEAFAIVEKKLKAAGSEKLKEEVKKQVEEYINK